MAGNAEPRLAPTNARTFYSVCPAKRPWILTLVDYSRVASKYGARVLDLRVQATEDQAGVSAAEAEGIRQGDVDRPFARVMRHEIDGRGD
jgi:hypothetical protein